MDNKPIRSVETVMDKRFLRLYDMELTGGGHYYLVSRRKKEDLCCLNEGEKLPDAVSCAVVIDGEQPRLLLSWEYRYPAGAMLLGVPAGLIDPEDRQLPQPLFTAAERELREETGLTLQPGDTIRVISPFAYSTPGMTDESNALIGIVLHGLDGLSQKGAVGTELFDGFEMPTLEEARVLLRTGRDSRGGYYSMYTWAALMWFASGMWREA